MATETGTATDYLDLLIKFRNFASGANSPSSGLTWQVLRDTSADSPNGGEYEMIFKGDGDASPAKEIFFGLKTYSETVSGRANWECKGMTGFNAGSPEGSVTFENQPGAQDISCYVPLRNATMSYWFYGNGRRLIMVAKTGTAYQWMYAGFINPYATEVEYPYPFLMGASSYNQDQIFNENDLDYASIPNPGGSASVVPGTEQAPLFLRFTDGQWYGIKNYSGTSFESIKDDRTLWPLMPITTTDYATENLMTNRRSFRADFLSTTAGGTPSALFVQTTGSPDDISPMFPLTIMFNQPSQQLVGEIDSCYYVSGSGGLASEDELIDNSVSPQQKYNVFTNIHRTDSWMFYAVKEE